jgi:hypothetical protein
MDTVSIVTKASRAIPKIMAATSPLVVTCVTVDAGSRMPDSHATPTTIAAIRGAAAAWKRKTDGKVAAIARASANPLRRVSRLSAITPAKSQTRHARDIQTCTATKYINVGGKFPTHRGIPKQAYITNTRSTKCGRLLSEIKLTCGPDDEVPEFMGTRPNPSPPYSAAQSTPRRRGGCGCRDRQRRGACRRRSAPGRMRGCLGCASPS